MATAPVSKINREFEERAAADRAAELGVPFVDLSQFPLNPDWLKVLSADEAERGKCVVFDKNGKKLRLAAVDPTNSATQEIAKLLGKKFTVDLFLCSEHSFKIAFDGYKSKFLTQKKIKIRGEFQESGVELSDFEKLEKRLPDLHAQNALNEIEILAMKSRASDIHFQPDEKVMRIRFRIDGALREVMKINHDTAERLIAHIKYAGGMFSNISDIPQDGRLDFIANNRKIDVRISVIPTEFLESIVLRILDSRRKIQTFVELGFSEKNRENLRAALEKKEGLVLVTGPTGSGKTTTLYSMLSQLNSPDKKLVTLEDPIEYHLENVSQSQINEQRGYSFANGLKSILRHDPDVILVGEIRDLETARLALEASLTGHAVLSSLHTNSAPLAIARLRNIGIKDFSIASTITAVFAQRLVRTVCQHCKKFEKFSPNDDLKKDFARMRKNFKNFKIPAKIPRAVGCEKCAGTGFFGQTAIAESFLVSDDLRKLIIRGASGIEIEKFLREKQNFFSLREDGLQKVFAGETTISEIFRVA